MKIEKIYLAGGCFWGTEHYMKDVPGVTGTRVGYVVGMDGESVAVDPKYVTYRNVCGGNGHAEAVEVEFDAEATTLREILEEFAYTIDPTILNRQGPDIGVQYRTGIYYLKNGDTAGETCEPCQSCGGTQLSTSDHAKIVTEFLADLQKEYNDPIVTENYPLLQFVEAEEYHQKYLIKNRFGYCHINFADIARKKAEKSGKQGCATQ